MTGSESEFAPVSESDWRALASGALKGGSLEALTARLADGIELAPIYGAAQGPRALRSHQDWRVIARIDDPDAHRANAQLLEDLEGGANGIDIIFAGAAGAYGFGLGACDAAHLHRVFNGFRFDAGVRLALDLSAEPLAQASAVANLIERTGEPTGRVNIGFGLDPLGALARTGRAAKDWRATAQNLAQFSADLLARGFSGPFACADGRIIHDAGGTPAQELAFALAAGLAYVRALEGQGVALAFSAVEFRLSADADEYVTLCKFRALRLLWARVAEVSGAAPSPIYIHAASAWRMMSARDPWTNVLRASLAAFSAGCGGADGISLLPYSQAIGLPNAAARRLARNAQLILLAESHLGFVSDPAAGSGAFERLTAALCEKAWALFQDWEGCGGLFAALVSGVVQGAVKNAAQAQIQAVATRRSAVVGVSAYPDMTETMPAVLPAASPAFSYSGNALAAPLPAMRLAEAFERLRDASDAALAQSGARPKLWLARIGEAASAAPRAEFARALFELAGVEAAGGDHFDAAPAMAAAFAKSGARLACLCGSDAAYAALGEAAARALRLAGAAAVYIAGKPDGSEAALRAAGVGGFIYAGCDAIEVLTDALQRCGAPIWAGGVAQTHALP